MNNLTKAELIKHCLDFENTYEDYPFDEQTAVIRHIGNKKIFALVDVKVEKTTGKELYVNLKCEPFKAEFLRSIYSGITAGWHMNKKHWNTIIVNSDVPKQELLDLIQHSFDLTKLKTTRRKKNDI